MKWESEWSEEGENLTEEEFIELYLGKFTEDGPPAPADITPVDRETRGCGSTRGFPTRVATGRVAGRESAEIHQPAPVTRGHG